MSIFKTSKSISDQNQLLESASSLYNSIEPLEEGVLNYTPSMVPVHARETADGTKYLVESDMLNKLEMPIVEAFNAVCESNDIDPDDTYVTVPDDEDIVADIAESTYVANHVASNVADTKALMEAGINVLSCEPLLEFGVNKELKSAWKSKSEDDSPKAIINKLFSIASTKADYKFVKAKAKKLCNKNAECGDDLNPIITKCDEKIAELKNKSKNNDGEE